MTDASERARQEDWARAGQAKGHEQREQVRQAAENAHSNRLARIESLAASFAQSESRADATTVFKEMTRILQEEGVDAAVACIGRQRQGILARVSARRAAAREQDRAELLPLLKAAGLHETKGQATLARAGYRELLALDPAWPDLLESFAQFLRDQSSRSQTHGGLTNALADARQSLELAERLNLFVQTNAEWQRVFAASLNRVAGGAGGTWPTRRRGAGVDELHAQLGSGRTPSEGQSRLGAGHARCGGVTFQLGNLLQVERRFASC